MITKYPFELQGLINPQSFVTNPFTKDKYKSEFQEFTLSKLKPYVKVSERATNDFKKRGCYYF